MTEWNQCKLIELLSDPKENITQEYKSWLNLRDSQDQPKLAKAAIALANFGGGIIVLGMQEQDGEFKSTQNPYDTYDTDLINSAINKYADPAFHCEIRTAEHPETKVKHAFVIVPETVPVPIMTKKGSAIFKPRMYFTRKPGPQSEEIIGSSEWQAIIERLCRTNSKNTSITQEETESEVLTAFASAARARWNYLIQELADADVARLKHGYLEVSFSVLGVDKLPGFKDVQDVLDEANRRIYRGHGPFTAGHRNSQQPSNVDGVIETWLGDPIVGNRYFDDCSFWRASRESQFFYLEGFYEDSGYKNWTPGKLFDISYSIRRFGLMLMFAAEVAKLLDDEAEILLFSRLFGMEERALMSERLWFLEHRGYICKSNAFDLEPLKTSSGQIEDNLIGILCDHLHQLYERFSAHQFYDLKETLVKTEIELLRKRGY